MSNSIDLTTYRVEPLLTPAERKQAHLGLTESGKRRAIAFIFANFPEVFDAAIAYLGHCDGRPSTGEAAR